MFEGRQAHGEEKASYWDPRSCFVGSEVVGQSERVERIALVVKEHCIVMLRFSACDALGGRVDVAKVDVE